MLTLITSVLFFNKNSARIPSSMHSSTALVTASSKETSFLPLAAGYLPDTSCSVSFDSFFSPYSVSSCVQENVFLLFQSSPAFLQLIGIKA